MIKSDAENQLLHEVCFNEKIRTTSSVTPYSVNEFLEEGPFDESLYDEKNPFSLHSIMSSFKENEALLGIRIKDRGYDDWIRVMNRFHFIVEAFWS